VNLCHYCYTAGDTEQVFKSLPGICTNGGTCNNRFMLDAGEN